MVSRVNEADMSTLEEERKIKFKAQSPRAYSLPLEFFQCLRTCQRETDIIQKTETSFDPAEIHGD